MSDYRALDPAAEAVFQSALRKIEGVIQTRSKDNSVGLKLLSRFEELKKYQSVYVHHVTEFKGETSSFIVLLVEKHSTVIQYRRHSARTVTIEEVEPMLIFSLPADMGSVMIKTETMADKLADLFHKVDIDFEAFPSFSRNYLLVGENPELVKSHLPVTLIETLDGVKDMSVEINGHWGLLRTERNLTETVLLLLISIGKKLSQ